MNRLPLVLILTLVCLFPVVFNGWVNWDDYAYVLENPYVLHFSWRSIPDLFTTFEIAGAYHPLTMLSLGIDYVLAGDHPMLFHITALLLHLVNTGLVYVLAHRLSGNKEVATITALLFGIHPMHLEAVAWISSRKDVLYGFFYIIGLILYEKYSREPTSWKWYGLCGTAFVLALLAKGMALTFPFLILLIDFLKKRPPDRQLWLEKVPFLAGSLLFAWIAVRAQQEGTAMLAVHDYPLTKTVFLGAYSLVAYFGKAWIPLGLSPYHPYPFEHISELPTAFYFSAIPVMLGLAAVAWSLRYTRKVLFGVAFFIGSLAPALQILPFGRAFMAERFSYIPYIGLFLLAGWGFSHFVRRNDPKALFYYLARIVAGIYLGTLGLISFQRTTVWKSSNTLWNAVIEAYPDEYFALASRGEHWYRQGDYDAALADLNASIEAYNRYAIAYNYRGKIYEKLQEPGAAYRDYDQAIRLDPQFEAAYVNRGILSISLKNDQQGGLEDLNTAIRLAPEYALAYLNRGVLYETLGQYQMADRDYSQAIILNPYDAMNYKYRGALYFILGKPEQALQDFNRAIEQHPNYGEAYFYRSQVHRDLKKPGLALRDAQQAIDLGFPVGRDYLNSLQP